MIGRMLAQSQIDRLAGLNCFVPSEDREAAEAELVEVLIQCDTSGIAAIVINRWLEDATEWPKPKELRRMVDQANAEIRNESRAAPCRICGGAGFTIVAIGMYTAAKPCECLPATHYARPGNDPREHEYWKPHWKYDRQDTK